MKNLKISFLAVMLFLLGTTAFSQARVQLVHNSADAALEFVDVWMDQTLLIDNLKFRTASSFMDAPSGVEFSIAICTPGSQNPNDPLWSHSYTLSSGGVYILVAEGIISTSGYDPATPFNIAVFPDGHEIANLSDKTDMLVHHGSTDAPTMDIYETGIGLDLLVDDLSYSEFAGYLELPTKNFIFEVRDETGTITLAAYSAPLMELGMRGKAITMVASGFLYPANNSDGPAFGLWIAQAAGGDLIELPVYDPKASVQLIHNSADTAAAVVDVWLNETLLIDNFEFRTASSFMEVQAEKEVTLAVAGPDSQNPDSPLWSQSFTFTIDQTYILVAEGIISTAGYDPVTPFNIASFPSGQETADIPDETDMLMHHGSTDAPTIDIYETGIGLDLLVNDLAYADFEGYLDLDPLDYIFEVRDETGMTTLGAYEAPFETYELSGAAVTVLASGFLYPENNSNGPAFGLWMALASGGDLIELNPYVPHARAQFIHNSADAALTTVDIWLNEILLLDNFTFRTASPYMDLPADEEFVLTICSPDSQNPDDPIWSHNYTLTDGATCIFMAEGIVSTSGYDPATPFDLAVYPQGREEANNSNQTDMLAHHGSTDTPTIDITEVGIGVGPIVDNLSYSEFAGYLGLATVNYIFQVRDETGMTKIAAYEAPFSTMGLQGDAVSVIASGFLEPGNNSNGPEFGLFLALASGGALVQLPVYAPTARLQIIHNSPDTAVEVVDVWMNQTRLLDNFAFRTASAFIDAPADETFAVAVKGSDSQDPYNPIWSHNYNLTEGETYIMVAEGIISESGYNPATDFDIAVYPTGRETATVPGNTDVLVHHGSTDAPIIDIVEVGVGTGMLVDNLIYAEFNDYLELPTLDYIFEIRDESGITKLASFRASLELFGLEGNAISVIASGFMDPASNNDGPAFGLWAALASGGDLIELPAYVPSARVQIIHNSADTAIDVMDVWMNDILLLDDFAFRTATPYLYIPSGENLTIAIKGPDSQDSDDPIWSMNCSLILDETYILVANGIVSPTGFNPAEPFNIYTYEGAIVSASGGSNTDVLVFHGATDVPTMDVIEIGTGAGTLADNLSYGNFEGYTELPTANYSINITDESATTVVANFDAPFADMGLDGESLTIMASGFLNPSENSGGPGFGLLAVQADGTAVMLTNTSGIHDLLPDISTINVFPNPARDIINISFELSSKAGVILDVVDMTGRPLRMVDLGVRDAGNYYEQFNIEQLPAGLYLLNIKTGNLVISREVLVK